MSSGVLSGMYQFMNWLCTFLPKSVFSDDTLVTGSWPWWENLHHRNWQMLQIGSHTFPWESWLSADHRSCSISAVWSCKILEHVLELLQAASRMPALWMIYFPTIHHEKLLTSSRDCQNLLEALLESCSSLIYSAPRGNCRGSWL